MNKLIDIVIIVLAISVCGLILFWSVSTCKRAYETIALERSGVVTSCKVVRIQWCWWKKERSYEVLLNGEKKDLYQSFSPLGGYDENDVLEVFCKEDCSFVVPKDSSVFHPNVLEGVLCGFLLLTFIYFIGGLAYCAIRDWLGS